MVMGMITIMMITTVMMIKAAYHKLGLLPPPLAGEGWGGEGVDQIACPLPVPPPQAGEGTLRH